jgi:mannose/fructose/N-acetylgalactosamine-specific phosphotransferase system component IID
MPNLLPLALVMLIWWLVARKRVSPTVVMVAVILLGVLGAIPVWPGLNDKGEFLRVGLFK